MASVGSVMKLCASVNGCSDKRTAAFKADKISALSLSVFEKLAATCMADFANAVMRNMFCGASDEPLSCMYTRDDSSPFLDMVELRPKSNLAASRPPFSYGVCSFLSTAQSMTFSTQSSSSCSRRFEAASLEVVKRCFRLNAMASLLMSA